MSGKSIISFERLLDLSTWVGSLIVVIYIGGMFFWPFIAGNGSWEHVQDVWDRWQAVNVGMLAFVSSLIAFNISRYNAERQRQRDFLAARAFLPAAFSSLIAYLDSSASFFVYAWSPRRGGGPAANWQQLPEDYKQIFSECIRYANVEVGQRLAFMLALLQVHDARFRELVQRVGQSSIHREVAPEICTAG